MDEFQLCCHENGKYRKTKNQKLTRSLSWCGVAFGAVTRPEGSDGSPTLAVFTAEIVAEVCPEPASDSSDSDSKSPGIREHSQLMASRRSVMEAVECGALMSLLPVANDPPLSSSVTRRAISASRVLSTLLTSCASAFGWF